MKRFAVLVALAAIAGAIVYLMQPAPSTASNTAPPPPPPAAQPITKVTKLESKQQRAKLAEQIAQAQAARAVASAPGRTGATSAPKPPSLPNTMSGSDTELLRVEIRTAMRDVIPILAACYEAAIPSLETPNIKVVAELTLTGDPDIGTLIDAKQLADDTGKPLPTSFDDCMRSTFQSLALPPLAEGDKVEVRYPFVFSSK